MPSRDQLAEFTAWCAKHITGDEKGEAQIFLDHLFLAFGHQGGLKEAASIVNAGGPTVVGKLKAVLLKHGPVPGPWPVAAQ